MPETLGRYELITRLATGGMAEILLARERGLAGLERLVVIKRILAHLADDRAFIQMFLREARIQARLAHPNVVHIHELGEAQGGFFIAMEYIHGCTLREIQVLSHRAARPIPPAVAVSIVEAACRGAHAAHELCADDGQPLGVVHRDVSPHNLMVTADGHVKLLDFGIARSADASELTRSDGVRGKLGYMSPEQVDGEPPLDRRSDIFSLGVILWELLTGRPLFKRKSELEVMKAITETEAPPAQTFNPAVPDALDAVVMRALERDRERRFDTAEAMRRALAEAARGLGYELSSDTVAGFVGEVAGARLAERDAVLEKAREHALSAPERDSLVHTSDSAIFDITSMSDAQDRPAGATPTHDRAPTSTRRRLMLLALGVALVFAGAAMALLLGSLGQHEPSETEARAEAGPAPEQPPEQPPEVVVYEGEPLVIGWAPTVDPSVLGVELEPLRGYLEGALRRPVRIELPDSYGETADGVLSGRFAFGVFPPLLYVRTSAAAEAGQLELIAVKAFEGAIRSDGYLLVTQSAPYPHLAALAGKRFCFTDPNSTSGNFLPRAFIRRQGHDPQTFIGDVHWSGDHLQVLRDLLAGKCDAAATWSGSLLTASSLGVPAGRLRVLAITGHIPQDVVVAGRGASADERAALREALLAFEPRDSLGQDTAYLGDSQRITGFEAAGEDLFESLRDVVAEQAP